MDLGRLLRALRPALGSLLLSALAAAQDWGPWWGLGPFDEPGGATSLATEHPPEKALVALRAGPVGPDLAAVYRGKGGAELRWTRLDLSEPDASGIDCGRIDLVTALPQVARIADGSSHVVAYLYRRIECTTPAQVSVSIGSDDGLRLWLDGQLLIDRPVARGVHVRDHSLLLELGPGAHHLVAKVAQGGGAWGFEMRPWTRVPQEAIDQAIDRGVRFLLDRQLLDGSWAGREEWGAGYTAFCLYTLLKCGLSPEHAAARRALAFVRARPPTTTYAAATALLAYGELRDEGLRPEAERALAALIEWQEHHGRYGYPVYPGGGVPPADLSNSLFAALALRSAAQRGLRVPEKTWRQLIEGTFACQERGARAAGPSTGGRAPALGFSYREREKPTGSMTTAAISILALAREQLGSRLPGPSAARIEQAVRSGLSWLELHGDWTRNPNHGWHHYYYVYGLERVGALLGEERLAGCTWYPDGAEYLVRSQGAEGSWKSFDQHEYEDTLLALLFLKRATLASTGGSRSGPRDAYATAADATVRLRARGDAELTIWIEGFSAEGVAGLEWPGEQGKGPRVSQVEFLARFLDEPAPSERLLGTQPGLADRPLGDRRFALKVELERRGRWALWTRVHLAAPAQDAGGGERAVLLESPELVVQVENVLAPNALRYAAESRENQVATERSNAEASSQQGDGHAARLVGDGRLGTSWRCEPGDAEPWVALTFERPVRAQRLALSHAQPRADGASQPRARRVEVRINGKDTYELLLDPDPLAKGELRFDRLQRVRRVDVRVLESIERRLGVDGVGFSELELFLDR